MTLGILTPYQNLGIGTYLLKNIIIKQQQSINKNTKRIVLHVQISNKNAIRFYLKMGFELLI
jgi:ribosomal protein S18 acetylase RimI-like enzyme